MEMGSYTIRLFGLAFTGCVLGLMRWGYAIPTITTLISFDGNNGASPFGSLIRNDDGNFYGTTVYGGTDNRGTVFRITPFGSLTTLASFTTASIENGSFPIGPLIQDTGGNLYGVTTAGGWHLEGAVFKLSPTGVLTNLVSMDHTHGGYPVSGLVTDNEGNFYGANSLGPSFDVNSFGTIFQVSQSGTLTTLFNFDEQNGSSYDARGYGLTVDDGGTLYGFTTSGGANALGTVFRLSSMGDFSTLITFDEANGAYPTSLFVGKDGDLYGTTEKGGTNNLGTIFRLRTSGLLTTLISFDGDNGANPWGKLLMDDVGDLYGTTYQGGVNGLGTVFRFSEPGGLTTLLNFNGENGANPYDGLVPDTAGNLFGTTGGGANNLGTIFKLSNTGFVVPEPVGSSLPIIGVIILRRRESKR